MSLIDYLPILLTLLAIGASAGVLAGLLGVGGGIILVPGFFYAFDALGYDHAQLMQICVATSLATIVVTSARSVQAHHRKGAVAWDILRTWAPGIMLGALIGVAVARQLSSVTLTLIFGGILICVGLYMIFGRKEWVLGEQMPSGWLRGIWSGLIGFFSAMIGIGGGSFAVPTMSLHRIPIHNAVATSAGFGLLIALPSAIGFLLSQTSAINRPPLTIGYVNLPAFLVVIAMTLLTTPLGVRLAHYLPVKLLKKFFGYFVLIVATSIVIKAI